MADTGENDRLPQATVVPPKRTRISMIWVIPIIAALVAVGIAVQRYRNEGPRIRIIFSSANGIEAGKTFIKYKDVNIGQVTAVHLAEGYSKVEVTAKITKPAAGLMVEDAKFYVVRPRVTLSGISGLNTLLSGNYIGFQAGKSEETADTFVGIDEAPVVADKQGRQFTLKAPDLGSLDVGSPIYYRKLAVGQVTGYTLDPDGRSVQIKVFVESPYDKYVYPETRFWNSGGVDVELNADGVNVRTESLVSLLIGSVSFDVPPFASPSEPAKAQAAYAIYADRDAAMKTPDPVARHYVMYFDESLRGLSVGAPVTFLGLNAGEVTEVGIEFDEAKKKVRPRVTVAFYQGRLLAALKTRPGPNGGPPPTLDERNRRELLKTLVEKHGLRAQLGTGSLVTGKLYVALDYHLDAPKAKILATKDSTIFPTVPSDLASLEAKISSVLDKIDNLPLDAISEDLRKNLKGLDATLASVTKLVSDADAHLVPELKGGVEDMRRTLAGVERATNNANATLLDPNSPAQQDLRDALREFTAAARSIRALTDLLERQPGALLRGKQDSSAGAKQ